MLPNWGLFRFFFVPVLFPFRFVFVSSSLPQAWCCYLIGVFLVSFSSLCRFSFVSFSSLFRFFRCRKLHDVTQLGCFSFLFRPCFVSGSSFSLPLAWWCYLIGVFFISCSPLFRFCFFFFPLPQVWCCYLLGVFLVSFSSLCRFWFVSLSFLFRFFFVAASLMMLPNCDLFRFVFLCRFGFVSFSFLFFSSRRKLDDVT